MRQTPQELEDWENSVKYLTGFRRGSYNSYYAIIDNLICVPVNDTGFAVSEKCL